MSGALAPPDSPGGAVPAPGVSLDLHEELCLEKAFRGCDRWPKAFKLRNQTTGEIVPGRCKSTNLCAYCARLAAVENAEMLALDALEGDAPRVWCVLTTRSTNPDADVYYSGRRKLLELLRQVLGRRVEYASQLEFTTGYGPRSGGERRPHWNLLLKGVRPEDVEWVRLCIALTWCQLEDAELWAQHVGEIPEAQGLMRYLALHFQKESQAPPDGWSGQRFNCSQGYFSGCSRRVARQRARESLRLKREVWKAQRAGESGHDAELTAQLAVREQATHVWVLATCRGAAAGPRVHDVKRTALHPREWHEPDLILQARSILAGLTKPPEPVSQQLVLDG